MDSVPHEVDREDGRVRPVLHRVRQYKTFHPQWIDGGDGDGGEDAGARHAGQDGHAGVLHGIQGGDE